MMRSLITLMTMLFCIAIAPHSSAQDYPNKPIKLVVPYPPGGSADILARIVAEKLDAALGAPVVVENRPGAGTAIGADLVAKSRPDGYTLLLGTVSSHAMNPALSATVAYDPIKDFAPIAQIATIPFVLDVNPSIPAKTVKEFVDYAKSRPGQINYSSAGNGTSNHLAGELFKEMAGVNLVHVPYRGSAPALQDLIAGNVQAMFDLVTTSLSWINSGKIKALAVTSSTRLAGLPEVPTMKEAGYPDYEVSAWFGLFAPAGTPAAIVNRLNAETNKALAAAETKGKLTQMGMEIISGSPQSFRELVAREFDRWRGVVKSANIHAD